MSLKSYFIQLSIKNQILFGIYSISIVICLNVFLLVIATSFMLVSFTYNRMKMIIESNENKVIELFNLFGDISANVFFDLSKIEVLMLRKHQNFLMNHTEFLDNINSIGSNEKRQDAYIVNDPAKCTQSIGCIFNASAPSSISYPGYELAYRKILMLMIPISNIILKSKYYAQNDISVITKIHFISNHSIFYQYPVNTTTIMTVDEREIPDLIKGIKAKYTKEHLPTLNLFNTIINTSYANLTLNNPTIFTSFSAHHYPLLFNNLMLPSTASVEFKVSNQDDATHEQFDSFDNYTSVYWSGLIIEQLSSSLSTQIAGLYTILLANTQTYPVLSPLSCELIKRLAYFYTNPEENYTITPPSKAYSTLESCFPVKEANEIMKQIANETIAPNQARQIIVPLASYSEKNDINKILQFKVLLSLFPSKSIHSLVNSPFYITFPVVFLFLKNINGTLLQRGKVSDYLQNVVLLIISVFLIVWLFVFIYIIIRVYSVSREISDPIQKLINSISMNIQEDDNKGLDSITYKDDKDINDLFKICKELIFGGFNQGQMHKTDTQLNVYNNIAIVKSNNMMINEYNIEGKRDEDVELLFGDCDQDFKEEQSPLKKFENEVYKKHTTKEYENELGSYLKRTLAEEKKKLKSSSDSNSNNNKEPYRQNTDKLIDTNKEMVFMKKVSLDKKLTFMSDGLYVKYNEIFLNEGKEKKK